MAKKRKGGKRRKPAPRAAKAPAQRPQNARPAAGPTKEERRAESRERRVAAAQARQRERRRQRLRTFAIAAVVVLALAGLAGWRVLAGRQAKAEFRTIADAAGCTEVKKTKDTGSGVHIEETQAADYEDSPPTSGPHWASPLRAGFYPEPFASGANAASPSLYQAVHSLEHGYVIAWFSPDLEAGQRDAIADAVRDQRKVIAVPYRDIDGGEMAMTAWARTMTCRDADPDVIGAFAERFREATAPEANAE